MIRKTEMPKFLSEIIRFLWYVDSLPGFRSGSSAPMVMALFERHGAKSKPMDRTGVRLSADCFMTMAVPLAV